MYLLVYFIEICDVLDDQSNQDLNDNESGDGDTLGQQNRVTTTRRSIASFIIWYQAGIFCDGSIHSAGYNT